jgi:hypothetical protein
MAQYMTATNNDLSNKKTMFSEAEHAAYTEPIKFNNFEKKN